MYVLYTPARTTKNNRVSIQACSTTARRGALDWAPIFEKANKPVFEALYKSVRDGTETRKSLEFNGRSTYREDLAKELEEINNQEIWRAGMYQKFAWLSLVVDVRAIRQDCTGTPTGLQARVILIVFLRSFPWFDYCSFLEERSFVRGHCFAENVCTKKYMGTCSLEDSCFE